jgi:membrane-associated phospholipid phosphatase
VRQPRSTCSNRSLEGGDPASGKIGVVQNVEADAIPPTPPPASQWPRELGWRMRHLFALKMIGISAFTSLFFVAYFHLLRQPIHPVILMPLTALDRVIPFVPQALFPYLSLWVYVGTAPGLQRSFAELLVYGLWVGALCLTGLALFYFWPTQIPPLALDVSGLPGFKALQGVDAAGNACPSMHVAVAIFTVIRLEDVLRRTGSPPWLHAINGLWFLSIALSTLFVKQHVVLDFTAGALLGVAFALPSLRWRPASERRRNVVQRYSAGTAHAH